MSPTGNIVNFPDRPPVEDEAARWVVRHGEGPLTTAEQAQFDAWKQASPAHGEAFARLSAHWKDLDVLAALADTPAEKPLWMKPSVWGGVGMAAAVAFAVMFGVSQFSEPGAPATQVAEQPGLGVYKTELGDQEKITLADGSVVTLNTASRIEARMNDKERTIRLLEGEAFFEVAHDPSRPFSVYAGDGVTVAVGTAFSVRLEQGSVEVVVSEGKVSYSRVADVPEPEPVAYVAAGETALFGDSVVIDRVDLAAIDRKLSWIDGKLVFSGDPLSSVVADISRYADIRFEFDTQDLADMRVGGVFGLGEVDDMLEALETNFGVRAERIDDKHVRIVRQDP
jgi:transmembrane sensor